MEAPWLFPVPRERLVDGNGNPYFLWDTPRVTLERFEELLLHPDPDVRAYCIGKVMRQARPDETLAFVAPRQIVEHWDRLERYLGKMRPFWTWLVAEWRSQGLV